jgi:signal transduction histidine kinase
VEVKDGGIGISGDNIDRVFTRFFRVRGLASTFSGSGIGLYISSEIIKRHGGEIWVESEEGKGSTFYFTIPPQLNREQ